MSGIEAHKWLVTIVALMTGSILGCSPTSEPPPRFGTPAPTDTPTVTMEDKTPISGEAQVDSIETLVLESCPVQIHIVAKGNLPDGCTKIDEIAHRREGNDFVITITTVRPGDAGCTDALVPFMEVIPLDVVGLEAGTYGVTVNGVKDSFKLGIDNTLPEEPGAGDVITGGADVESIKVLMLESFPVQINVVVKGNLPDGCTEIDRIVQHNDMATNTLGVAITTSRPADAICTQALVSFEEIIPLNVNGLEAGAYTVDVNGVTDTFRLDVDNVLER